MWINNNIYLEDLETIVSDENIKWEMLRNQSFLITGATGLIGSLIVNTLLYLNKIYNMNIKVYALVRNIEDAKKLFKEQLEEKLNLYLICGDVCERIKLENNIDYIIHTASQTSSKKFVEEPVETINVILQGTKNILELAKEKKIKDFIFLSTMEIYGKPSTDEKIDELYYNNLNTMEVRDCYPIAKFMAENLCVCYASQYNINAQILRLTQTFGPGVNYNDNRVFAEFAKAAIEGRNIVLHTLGETKRNYLYTADAIRAIFTIMLKGENKAVYNVANEETYCSIAEMAELVSNKCTSNKITVNYEIEKDINKYGYAKTFKLNLNTEKLRKLGWKPIFNLENMFKRLILTMEEYK